MNTKLTQPSNVWMRHTLAAATLAVLAACGGGGGSSGTAGVGTGGTGTSGVGTGGTGTYAAGSISGFGSIIVNGVRYDDSGASVLDDDGVRRTNDVLKLGMSVEVTADKPTADASGVSRSKASEVRYSRSVTGPITSIDSANQTLVIFGKTVKTTSATVYDGLSGFTALAVNQVLEVYAETDANGQLVATRLERKDATAPYRLTGVVSNVDTAKRQFNIGTVLITSSAALPSGVVNGAMVRVRGSAGATANSIAADLIQVRQSGFDDSVKEAEVEGYVSSVASSTQFVVNGITVNTTSSTKFEGATTVSKGDKVEVEGTVANNVLTATKVEVKSKDEKDDSGSGSGSSSSSSSAKYEVHGTISNLDKTKMTFVIRDLNVRYNSNTKFKDGTVDQLSNGRQIEVKAVRDTDGSTLVATEIDVDD